MIVPHYEYHITFHTNRPAEIVEEDVKRLGWKHSMIDGDPTLGEGVRHYATLNQGMHVGRQFAIQLLHDTAAAMGRFYGFDVVRMKIEVVVYDNKEARG